MIDVTEINRDGVTYYIKNEPAKRSFLNQKVRVSFLNVLEPSKIQTKKATELHLKARKKGTTQELAAYINVTTHAELALMMLAIPGKRMMDICLKENTTYIRIM